MAGCRTRGSSSSKGPAAVHTNAAVEDELQKIINAGEQANADVERWIAEIQQKSGTKEEIAAAKSELRQRIQARYGAVRKSYADFIRRHPKHAGGYASYGDFLLGHYDEDGAAEQLEKALKLYKKNPTVYNDLANIYGHSGSVKKAFDYYARAIQADPTEPIYYQNFGTTVFLFRKDAKEFYGINEQQVFDKALMLYSNATRLDPTNFALASDVAETYYGIKPWRFKDALRSWTNALALAHDETEREQVYTHFARIETQAGRYDEARSHLRAVTNATYAKLKDRMLRNIQEHEQASTTNSPPASR